MDLQLNDLFAFGLLDPQSWLTILLVALGLSAVIFVHELGHFLVAKACGVKCEKFYIGFDINGYKLFKFQWGETEYGIGVLPLGGYVKMLGQEDNPARVQEEMEKAKLSGDPSGEGFKLDPRSYLAQSVPERMAIISAGVIMNVIFAVVFASIAYAMGVEYSPAQIGSIIPGEAAWQAGLRPGDTVLSINGEPAFAFNDLTKNVALGDIEDGVQMTIRRAGVSEPITLLVRPERKPDGLAPRIGAQSMSTSRLYEKQPVFPDSPAAKAEPAFEGGDKIVAVNGEPIESYMDLQAALVAHASETLELTVERKEVKPEVAAKTVKIRLPPNPLKWIGVETELGPVVAVQADSPATSAGIKSGDRLLALNGEPPGNPLTLPERLRALAGQPVSFEIDRSGERIKLEVTPRTPTWHELPLVEGSPMSAPALGIAYSVSSKIVAVEAGSPAEQAQLKPGDVVASARLIQPKAIDLEKARYGKREKELDFTKNRLNWPAFFTLTQYLAPGSKIELTLAGGRKVELEAVPSADAFTPERGLQYEHLLDTRTAKSFGEALKLGKDETVDSLLMVVRFLRKIGTQVSPLSMGGPGTIFAAAGASAEAGMSALLLFLCMLSANLAVINFLPIPVLDGGHMMFLAYEGIFRKPLTEKWFMRLTYAGFAFILLLMVFVIGLDVNRGIEWVQSLLQ